MSKSRKREQTPKGGANKALTRAMQGKRMSNAAGFHTPKTAYKRKGKHGNVWE